MLLFYYNWFQIYKCNEHSLYSDDLLKEKASNLLVVLSGKVASATPFNCKHDDDSSSGDVFEAKVKRLFFFPSLSSSCAFHSLACWVSFQFEMEYETKKDDDGGLIHKSHNFLLQINETPWYLVSYNPPQYLLFVDDLSLPIISLAQSFRKTVLVW